ncbi:MAG: LPS export ABC transporter permease LptG [Kangiellaceae bacterium]
MFSQIYTRLDRYIAQHVVMASLLILFLLIALRAMFALLEESNSIGRGNYELADAVLYVGLMLPQKVLELFPMGVLIGSLFGLGVMASSNELTVMRASGMTTWRIAGSTLKASLVLMAWVFFLSEVIAPAASKSAHQLKTAALSSGKITSSSSGLWAKNNQQIIQISSLLSNGDLHDLYFYDLDKNFHLTKLTYAKSAKKVNNTWVLFNVNETSFLSDKIEQKFIERETWINPLDAGNIETLTLKPETLNLRGLVNYQDYLNKNQLDSGEVTLAFWEKVMLPVSIAIMMLLAASFVFGPMRDVSMGARILTGVMLGFAFHLAKQTFGPVSLLYGVSPFLGALTPLVVFAALAFHLMRKSS